MKATDIQLSQIDELGILSAQIADLSAKAEAIKDALKDVATDDGTKVFEGNLFKATVIEANRKVVDYKSLLAELGATNDQIERHTKISAVFSVKTTAR
jgi:hypothetical protein